MKQEHLGREAQESPGFSRGEEVNEQRAGERLSIADVSAVLEERWAMVPACTAHYPRPCGCEPYEVSGMDEFYGPTSLWVDPSPVRPLALFEEEP